MEEIISKGTYIKEPGYLYYLNGEGNVCRQKKEGIKHKVKPKKIYSKINLNLPKSLLTCWISEKVKTVRKFNKGGMIHFPSHLVGKNYRVILIPETDFSDTEESFNPL